MNTIINMGEEVCCDFCNGGEETMGGVVIGSCSICGDCAQKHGYYDESKDEVDKVYDIKQTFKQNVLDHRLETTGSTDGIIEIIPF